MRAGGATPTSPSPGAEPSGSETPPPTLDVADRLGIDLNQLDPLPSLHGRCFKPRGGKNPSDAEVSLGDRVAEAQGEDLIFPRSKNQAGIDGFFRVSGRPVQLKTLTGDARGQPGKMVTRANEAFEAATRDGWSNVDVHIEAPYLSKDQATQRWSAPNRQPKPRDTSGGAVERITVHCADGSIRLPIPRHDLPISRTSGAPNTVS
jgi:hypothetical protein